MFVYSIALYFLIILYCMAMRGIPEYIAQARTILHASVGQVQYGPSAGNIFWFPPNIKPCNMIIIIYKSRHFYFNYRGCGQILLSIDTVYKMYQCWFDEIFLTLQATCYGCDYYVTIDNVSWIWLLRHNRVRANALRSIVTQRALRDSSAQSVLRIRVIDERRAQYGLLLHGKLTQ